MRKNFHSKDNGFTIIELMVAITVLSVIVAIIATSLVSVADTSEIAREAAQEIRIRQFIARSLSDNIASLYIDPGCTVPAYKLLGTPEDGSFGPADAIEFCTSQPMPGTKTLPAVIKRITYSVATDNEAGDAQDVTAGAEDANANGSEDPLGDKEGVILLVRQEPLIVNDPDSSSTDLTNEEDAVVEQQIPIQSIDIEYYNGVTEEWVDEWDSETEGFLPWALHIKINFARTRDANSALAAEGINSDEDPDFDMTYILPAGAGVITEFLDNNHMRSIVDDLDDAS